jgi:hypothetical protein
MSAIHCGMLVLAQDHPLPSLCTVLVTVETAAPETPLGFQQNGPIGKSML